MKAAALLILLGTGCHAQEPTKKPVKAGKAGKVVAPLTTAPKPPTDTDVPNFVAAGLTDHKATKLRGLKLPLLVNIWASWCGPCRHEMPALRHLHAKYAGRGLTMIGISTDAQAAPALALQAQVKLPYRQLHDPHNRASAAFQVQQLPATYLYGADGMLSFNTLQAVRLDDSELINAIETALKAGQRR